MGSRRSAAAIVIAVVACFGPTSARAASPEDAGFELRWRAPAICPDHASASASLRAQLRGEPAEGSADVAIVEDARGYTATIAITGTAPFATRELVAGDCEALARASVLVIAVAIDPVAVVGAIDPVTDPATDPITDWAPQVAAPDVDDPAPKDDRPPRRAGPRAADAEPRPRSPWSHRLRVAGGIGTQATGVLHGAAQLGYAAAWRAARIEVQATWGSPRTLRYDDGAGVRVQSIGVGMRGCIAPVVGIVGLPVCAGLVGGPTMGRGRDVPRRTLAINGWLSAELGVAAIVRVAARVGIVIAADAQVAVLRPAFHLGERAEVVGAPPVGGKGIVGLEVKLRSRVDLD